MTLRYNIEEKRHDKEVSLEGKKGHERVEQGVREAFVDQEQELSVEGLDGHNIIRIHL
jgi:hypothetical protein